MKQPSGLIKCALVVRHDFDERALDSVEPALRRTPQQDRSRTRVLSVLEVADRLLAEQGVAALTTSQIAAAAGVSVGSLYQYFPDKETIVEALALGYWSELVDLVTAAAETDELDPLEGAIDQIIDSLAAGFRARPGFLALWYGGLRTERVRNVTRPGRIQVARAVDGILTRRWPDSDPDRRATVARMIVLAGDGLLREAFRLEPEGDETVLAETKRMLNAYVADSLIDPGIDA
jgi:AcrR family transcriptional regulator